MGTLYQDTAMYYTGITSLAEPGPQIPFHLFLYGMDDSHRQ
jgi:hypothetical protein